MSWKRRNLLSSGERENVKHLVMVYAHLFHFIEIYDIKPGIPIISHSMLALYFIYGSIIPFNWPLAVELMDTGIW